MLRRSGRKGWVGGESYEEMADRIVGAVCAIAAAHRDEQVLVVTHNGPIRAVHAHVSGVAYTEYRQSAKSIKKGSSPLFAWRAECGRLLPRGIPCLPPAVLLHPRGTSRPQSTVTPPPDSPA